MVLRAGQRQSFSAASAVNAKGAFWFCTYEGALNSEPFIELLQQMMKYRRRPLQAGEKLRDKIEDQLAKLQQMPGIVRSFFHHPAVAYIADC